MNRWAQFRSFVAPLLLILAVAFPSRAAEEEVRGAPAEPDDAAEVRAQIWWKTLPTFADRRGTVFSRCGKAASWRIARSTEL
jgi:hypothetical protein